MSNDRKPRRLRLVRETLCQLSAESAKRVWGGKVEIDPEPSHGVAPPCLTEDPPQTCTCDDGSFCACG